MGLLSPLSLLYAASLAVLIAIYLLASRYPRLIVSSLLLFEELPSPVAKRRFQPDVFFWLEALALGTLSLAAAGLYLKLRAPLRGPSHRVLIFDIGAAMGASEGSLTRLELAKRQALKIISKSGAGSQFSVVTYALEAKTVLSPTSDVSAVRHALRSLSAVAVRSRAAAFSAALAMARQADYVDLFSDRMPQYSDTALRSLRGSFDFHQVGTAQPNLAIASLEPGVPSLESGFCVVRNFSFREARCELRIELNNRLTYRRSMTLAPRSQLVVPFGPLTEAGLLRAEGFGDDALSFDNVRYAYVPALQGKRVLIVSSDTGVGEDLARLVKAIAPQATLHTLEARSSALSANLHSAEDAQRYDLVVVYDQVVDEFKGRSLVAFFPRSSGQPNAGLTAGRAELDRIVGEQRLFVPIPLHRTRILSLPDWMRVLAVGAAWQPARRIPLVAIGRRSNFRMGVVAFDIRDHLLFDPDRLEVLELALKLVSELLAPSDVKVVATGNTFTIDSETSARVTLPDGATVKLGPDKDKQIRFTPTMVGRYVIETGDFTQSVFANYFDASESDLRIERRVLHLPPSRASGRKRNEQSRTKPLTVALASLALAALVAESALIVLRSSKNRQASV